MKLEKLDHITCLALQEGGDGPFYVSIVFDGAKEFVELSKQEIANISMWTECTSIRIENVRTDRRWRERSDNDRRGVKEAKRPKPLIPPEPLCPKHRIELPSDLNKDCPRCEEERSFIGKMFDLVFGGKN